MPISYTRMKPIYLRGLLWLYLLGFGMTSALSMEPGFLDFDNLPDTNFSCVGKVIGGYYADLETNCQMFHVCTIGQLDEPMDIRFLCLNGTVFDQETRVCERIDEVDCSKSEQFYSLNLELYGNTQPSILEENPLETDEPPIIIKSTTSTTTTTTTTTQRPKTTRQPSYYTTSAPIVTTHAKVISTHHFPISNQASDIRFNPAEINIRLNAGAPPNIRSKPVSFQEQIFDAGDGLTSNKKTIAHTTNYNSEKLIKTTTSKPKGYDKVTPSDINFGFTYRNDYEQTEDPAAHRTYQYHYRTGQFRNQFKTSTTFRPIESASTRKALYNSHSGPTTFRSYASAGSTNNYRTEKPQRLQLPLPLLPTLPPLQFSSPAPFSLQRHIETKRYTQEDHHTPPRIIISASASVSDASGRRLNYSLGTIGVRPLLEEPPKSYDDYKEEDVVLDPFYHDVPKVKHRNKRSPQQIRHTDVIRNEQEAVDVLKFLFDWYKSHEKTAALPSTVAIPVRPEDITEINDEFKLIEVAESLEAPDVNRDLIKQQAPNNDDGGTNNDDYNDEDFRAKLFQQKNKFNIVGDILSVTETQISDVDAISSSTENPNRYLKQGSDYVDDNYEPLTFEEVKNHTAKDTTVDNGELSKNYDENEETSVVDVTTVPSTTTTTVSSTKKSRRRGRTRLKLPLELKKDEENEKVVVKSRPSKLRGRLISLEYKLSNKEQEEQDVVTAPTIPKEEILGYNQNPTLTVPDTKWDTTTTETNFQQQSTQEDFTTTEDNLGTTIEDIITTTTPSEEVLTTLPVTHIESTTPFYEELLLPAQLNENSVLKEEELVQSTTLLNLSDLNETETTTLTQENDIVTSTETLSTTIATTSTADKISTVIEPDLSNDLTTTPMQETTTEAQIIETTLDSTEPEPNLTSAETTTEENLTEPPTTTTTRRPRTRPGRRKSTARHRFSTELFTPRPGRRKSTVEEEIINTLTNRRSQSETSTNAAVPTDAPLYKSVKPTLYQSDDGRNKAELNTTPMVVAARRTFIFNCFGRVINRFYSDPRDCRLFHYCTSGYTKNQLLDMKFVCDLGTYFDDEKLICTKTIPKRCLL